MDANHIQKIIQDSDSVVRWFGVWSDFHDAEILYLNLTRSGESALRVFPDFSQKPAFVDFFLEEVTDLELADFSSHGLAGRIDAKRIRVEVIPGKPEK